MNKSQGQVKTGQVKDKPKIEESSAELTAGIIRIITEELHRRVGIGAIWRQLSPTRRQEITEKWSADIKKYLTDHK